jgi:hypothetical protein
MNARPICNLLKAVVAIGVMSAGAATAQTPPDHIEAYVKSIKAEQAEQAGDMDASLLLYNQSLQLYQSVSAQFPQWRPDVVQYRITQTANQIERLQQAKRSVATSAEVATGASRPAKADTPPGPALEEEREAWLKEKETLTAALQQQADVFGRQQESWEKERKELMTRHEEWAARPTDRQPSAVLPDPAPCLDTMAALSNRIAVLEKKVEDVPDAPTGSVGVSPSTVEQMAEQIAALKETIDLNRADLAKVREYKSSIKSMEKENKALKKQVEEYNQALNVQSEK